MVDQVRYGIFQGITKHLLEDESPSVYITELSYMEELNTHPFILLWKLKDTVQSKIHHPEGSVWNHTLMVVDEAAKVRSESKDSKSFMWAALLHDIGKPGTTRVKKDKITSYDHDKEGEKLCKEFLSALSDEETFIDRTSSLVRYHMHMLYVLKELPFADRRGMLKRVDVNDMALLCKCDRLGRMGAVAKEEEDNYIKFLNILEKN